MERIGSEVTSVVTGLGPGGAMPEVLAAWPDAVGEQIARNAWPARIARDGTLHVSASSSTWAFELGWDAQPTSDRAKPSCPATAYATADS